MPLARAQKTYWRDDVDEMILSTKWVWCDFLVALLSAAIGQRPRNYLSCWLTQDKNLWTSTPQTVTLPTKLQWPGYIKKQKIFKSGRRPRTSIGRLACCSRLLTEHPYVQLISCCILSDEKGSIADGGGQSDEPMPIWMVIAIPILSTLALAILLIVTTW